MRSLVTSRKNLKKPDSEAQSENKTQQEIKMRNIVMLTAALMMGCGDKEEDSASDTAVAEDTAE